MDRERGWSRRNFLEGSFRDFNEAILCSLGSTHMFSSCQLFLDDRGQGFIVYLYGEIEFASFLQSLISEHLAVLTLAKGSVIGTLDGKVLQTLYCVSLVLCKLIVAFAALLELLWLATSTMLVI